jgi:ubiquinone/menaquinone biosynthesis C-methylase UbiE
MSPMAMEQTAPRGPESDADVGQFDRWALRYERSKWQWLHFGRVHGRAFALASRFARPSAILDVGCGTGRLLRSARHVWPGARLVGVDPSEGMVRAGSALTPGELIVAGAENIPLPDRSIDLAFSTIAFHHWSDPERGLREVARVLRPGGGFVLVDNLGPNWLAPILQDRPYLNADERAALWTKAGLRVLEQRRIVLLPVFLPVLLATVAVRDGPA